MIKDHFTVAVVGCGIVGGGTAKILHEQASDIRNRTGIDFRLKYVCDIRFDNARALGLPESLFVTDYKTVCGDPEVDVVTMELDTSNLDSFSKTVEQCEAAAKNIISVFSALETVYTQKECGKDLGKIKNMFQINYFSQVYFLSAIAPVLQKQACGEIIVLGSTAGEYGMPDNYAFGSTKAALHVWLQGFQAQMAQNHISVTTVKADDWDTVGERKTALFQKPLDPRACAEACLYYAQNGAKIRYFPWYSVLTVPFRRYLPYLNKQFKK